MRLEPEPFEPWYLREHPRLVSAMTVIAHDVDLAADVTDEAFARASERWSQVSRMDAPGGWVYTTALNVLRRRLRRRRLERSLLRREAIGVKAAPPDWSPEIWDALTRLPLRERTAVALRYVGDLTYEELADAMRISSGTVGAMLHSARQRLAEALGEPVDLAEPEETDASSE